MNENEKFELLTYLGVNDARFGMTPGEIEAIWGAPDSVGTNFFKQRIEYRSFMNVAYSGKNKRAVHFGFGPQMKEVEFNQIYLFQEDPRTVLEKLIAEDKKPYLYFGIVVFLNLGLTLSGFHDNDESQKGVTVFERGTYDDNLERMEPFSLKAHKRRP